MKTRILKETLQNGSVQYHPQWKSWRSFWLWKDVIEEQDAVAGATIRWHLYGKTKEEAQDILDKFLNSRKKIHPNSIVKKEIIEYNERT